MEFRNYGLSTYLYECSFGQDNMKFGYLRKQILRWSQNAINLLVVGCLWTRKWGKAAWAERAWDWCRPDKDSANLGLQSTNCPLEEEPHVGWKWPGVHPSAPLLVRTFQEEYGSSLNAQGALKEAAAGGCWLLSLEWTGRFFLEEIHVVWVPGATHVTSLRNSF